MRSIDVTPAGVKIEETLFETLSVSALAEVLGQPRIVPPDDPAPEANGYVPSTLAIWDDAGIFAFTKGGDEASELEVRLSHDPVEEARVKFDSPRCGLARSSREPSRLQGGNPWTRSR
ncbi:hypothetical protein C1706_08960 [Propioniciclava flava]|uniref:DUF7738 domain-containing protein n=1 Tax=Propioniciclava flava TaxID=2072026 RepID=A0A4Q2EHK3_9ACTN|nr:hypothetical protein C1706_08960 [Propioniciclava flava]